MDEAGDAGMPDDLKRLLARAEQGEDGDPDAYNPDADDDEEEDDAEPVSYTHLDVYKRQEKEITLELKSYSQAGIFKSYDKINYLYLVMPVRI